MSIDDDERQKSVNLSLRRTMVTDTHKDSDYCTNIFTHNLKRRFCTHLNRGSRSLYVKTLSWKPPFALAQDQLILIELFVNYYYHLIQCFAKGFTKTINDIYLIMKEKKILWLYFNSNFRFMRINWFIHRFNRFSSWPSTKSNVNSILPRGENTPCMKMMFYSLHQPLV